MKTTVPGTPMTTAQAAAITYWTCRICLSSNRDGVAHCGGCGRTAAAVRRAPLPLIPLPAERIVTRDGQPVLVRENRPAPLAQNKAPEAPAAAPVPTRKTATIVCPSCGGEGDIENLAGRCYDCENRR
jgi:hypothetical protein